jgi:hypothetical protein
LYSVVVAAILTEVLFRFTPLDRPFQRDIYQECGGRCGYVYGHRPGAGGISSQGLRDREFAIPKPPGVTRVLVLGDSIAFGVGVKPEETFAKRLEALVQPKRPIEVINSGVSGYTPYNERAWYKARGRLFAPDVVFIAFCMNDIVDPLPHWEYTGRNLLTIPDEAIPNMPYHVQDVLPRFAVSRTREVLSRYSHVFLSLSLHLAPIGNPERRPLPSVTAAGRTWPTYVTREDTKSLEVLMDYQSPEWQWLRRMYDDMASAIRHDGAVPVFLFFPLSYQLDPGYPLLPQSLLMRYCGERSLQCLDLLPLLRAHRSERPFFEGEGQGYYDVWHLTPRGHELVAQELAARLTGFQLQR